METGQIEGISTCGFPFSSLFIVLCLSVAVSRHAFLSLLSSLVCAFMTTRVFDGFSVYLILFYFLYRCTSSGLRSRKIF